MTGIQRLALRGEALGKGEWMSAFVKSIPLADRLIRRNPLYYGGFRRLLQQAERATLEERRALAERLLARSRGWVTKLPGYARFDLARPMAEQPVLLKEALQNRAEDFLAGSWLPAAHAATGGTTGVPLQLVRSLKSLTMEQAMIDHLAAKAGVELPQARVAVLRGDGIKAPLQIYRALDKLVDLGLAHRLESLNAFVACAHAEAAHAGLAAFAICEVCGRVDEFADAVVEERLGAWSQATGFKAERTTIEIRGHCKACVAAGN